MKNAGDGISENPNLKIFGGERPPTPPGLGRLRRANSTSSSYRYLVAYELNAQGWKKRLGLEGVGGWGGGGGISKMVIARGGTIFICNYFGGGG